jgi:thioredoxin 2
MEQHHSQIIQCSKCGAKNKIPAEKVDKEAKCGKCGSPLTVDPFVLRCTECWSRNRIPLHKINDGAKCGKCGSPLKTEELFAEQPFMVTDGNFDSKILKSPLPALVFAWAPWCPTCRAFVPVIDDFARESKGKVRVGKLNVDNNPALSSKYNILSVPQTFVFDKGQLRENLPGSLQKHEIMMKMAHYL